MYYWFASCWMASLYSLCLAWLLWVVAVAVDQVAAGTLVLQTDYVVVHEENHKANEEAKLRVIQWGIQTILNRHGCFVYSMPMKTLNENGRVASVNGERVQSMKDAQKRGR